MKVWGRFITALALAAAIAGGAAAQPASMCTDAAAYCSASIEPDCLARIGAGVVEEGTSCEGQFTAYRGCLATAVETCDATAPAAACSAEDARPLWAQLDKTSRIQLQAFVTACPGAPQAVFASALLQELGPAATAPPKPPASSTAAAPPDTSPPSFPTRSDLREAQAELKRLGLYAAAIDGAWGPGSRAAMRRFQEAAGISPADGMLTEASLRRLSAAPTPEPRDPLATLGPGERFTECDACPEMVVIPGGTFTMGSPSGEADRADDEGPTRSVRIAQFALGRTEVTRSAYARFVEATGRGDGDACRYWTRKKWKKDEARSWRSPGYAQSGDHPVVCVSWEDAQAYVAWLNDQVAGAPYRLPSEAEQEYAIRAKTQSAYPWGSDGDAGCRFANYADRTGKKVNNWGDGPASCDDGHAQTAPVGSLRANGFGLSDMSGNVWEWGADCWNARYSGAPNDGSAWMSGDCSRAVLRGGSWGGNPQNLRSANRVRDLRGVRVNFAGFRVARTLPSR